MLDMPNDNLANGLASKDKNIHECFQYVVAQAKKKASGNCAMIEDSVVYGWAHHYYIEPKAVIDTNEILEAWREGWHDEDGKKEPWELVTYPIMPNGHILLLFKMKGKIYGGRVPDLKEIHSITFFRVLELGVENGKAEILNKYSCMTKFCVRQFQSTAARNTTSYRCCRWMTIDSSQSIVTLRRRLWTARETSQSLTAKISGIRQGIRS